ncbi:MAG TPA: serine/threonine-protein kinase [Gemmatimonadaceae bacterium]|nr:serine/threonine-protein kinase [Gemmatimonadaceae bacterium]
MSEIPRQLQEALRDRYEILRELGRGGMAIVYAARDLKLDREVAIKVLLPDLAAVMGSERFSREIHIAGKLSNPHILPIYDSGNANGQLYFVMPLVQGENLRARLDREKQLPIDEALRLTIEVAQALDYAHKQGVVHRDIKPENILLEGGHAIVADFGIARAASSATEGTALTQTGMTLGTASYMSPEQVAAEKDLDGRSDLYSLACVTYEMLAGQAPFTGPNAAAIMARQALEMPPSLQVVRNTIPDEVEDAVFQALAKSKVDRYESAGDFADALQDCLALAPTVSRRASMPRVTASTAARRRLKQRRKMQYVGAAAAGVVALAAGGWFLVARGGGSAAAAPPARALDAKAVAILYFDDQSGGKLGFLADGLTEALIDQLDQVRQLRVISRSGVAQYRGRSVGVDSIAKVFEVGTIVKGTVREAGEHVAIGVQVIDGNTQQDLDTKTITLPMTDLVALQNAVADSVATFLRGHVGEAVAVRALTAGTGNSAAMTLVMRAERVRKDAEEAARDDSSAAARGFAEADSLLAEAEKLDPRWVTPVAMRSTVAVSQSLATNSALAAAPVIERGLAHAERALVLDAQNLDALDMRGRLKFRKVVLEIESNPTEANRLLESAKTDLLRVTDVDRTRALAWATLSAIHNRLEDFNQASLAAQRALEQDAFLVGAAQLTYRVFATSYDLENFAQAAEYCAKGRKSYPTDPQFVRCRLFLRTSAAVPASAVPLHPDSAWRDYADLVPLLPERVRDFRSREARMLVAAALVRANRADSARRLLEASRAGPDVDPRGTLLTTEAFVRTMFKTAGDTDEAFSLLARYVAANPNHRDGFATAQYWWWKPLFEDARWRQLMGSGGS